MNRRRLALSPALLLACAFALPTTAPAATAAGNAKVMVIGFDGMDPQLLERFVAGGTMPNFARFMRAGSYTRLGTAVPPQSPVAWSDFITGQDAGGHGIFDFIHRDPHTLIPFLSTSEATPSTQFFRFGKWKFPRGAADVKLLRHGTAFWELLADAGVDVTVFKIPSNFPPVACEARQLSGMGTPDILGTYGVFTYITDDPPADTDLAGGRVVVVDTDSGRFSADIPGPVNTFREGDPEALVRLEATLDPAHPAASFRVGDARFVLQAGEWSDWVTLRFPLVPWLRHVPGLTDRSQVTGICRFYLMETRPSFRLYVTPIQIDPRAPAMPISTPPGYSRELAQAVGPFYTQGLPEDTKALEAGVLDDDDYISLSGNVLQERLAQLRHELDRFRGLRSGFLFFYFNNPDQNCHMFWRAMDPSSPLHAAAVAHEQRIRDVYAAMDAALGEALAAVDACTTVIVMSDHGFAPYNRSFHVNSWLLENGYLALQPGVDRASVNYLSGVDWDRTRAYALGINGLYLNLRGRESRGSVAPAEREALLAELVAKLEAVVDPRDGQRAIRHAYRADRVYHGPHAAEGPDIILGYYRGFRGSNESALGGIPGVVFADNLLKWSGDHCMAADEVPGVIVANRPILKDEPTLRDLAPTLLHLFGVAPTPEMTGGDIFAAKGAR
ncbi:MAG: alkaline phosphatase family protein [Candidatus Krumholzibacteriia bacterium]